ncbi:MAG TPA: hypothetical protein VGO55_08780 [Allosphingosinicella sp.]|jgi:hypothetical protein|nr:hypothetical protein [Allosphingosinicella sp.]
MKLRGGSATSLALSIIIVGLIVFVAVFYGWWLIFKPVVPRPLIATLPALVISVGALLIARFFADKWAAAQEPGGVPLRPYHYFAYLFLFMVSAMGTVNAAFVLWEGSSVVRQDMAEVRSAYSQLDVYSQRALKSSLQNRRRSDLEAKLANLWVEIYNPHGGNYCGVGEAAEAIIADIRRIVPDMPIIRGTGVIRPCNRETAQRVFQSYADSARATLARDPQFLAFNGPAKEALLGVMRRNIAAMSRSFEQVEGLLSNPTAFASAEVQVPLATAASNYNDDYRHVAGLSSPLDEDIPGSVDVSQSQELGSFAAFFDIFASRILDPKTWAYLLIAILLDLALVYFLKQAFVRYRSGGSGDVVDLYRERGPYPKFLWVNPPVDVTQRGVRHV